jgi:ubiquinone/menaquinone biosynthesis C-methylase UbiE
MQRGLPVEIDLEKDPYSLYEGVDYEQFWYGSQKRKLGELENAIVSNLLPLSGRRIIDVGCGYGRLANCYLDRFQQIIMVDGSISLLHQALEKTRGRAIYIACDVTRLPFQTASFDAVLMIRVFHHIEDSQACLSELHRLLCNDGKLVFSYCNKQNARRVVRWLLGTQKENPFTKEPSGVRTTFISHHPKAVHGMLSQVGFSKMQYYGAGVLDRLTPGIGFTGRWRTLAKDLAPFFAKSKIAPWILCQAISRGNPSLIDIKGINDLLQCPSCGGNLSDEKNVFMCIMCKRRYPVVDEIIDLRVK